MSCGQSGPERLAAVKLDARRESNLLAGLISPRAGAGVCRQCFDMTDRTDGECVSCARSAHEISAVVPISYSVAGERLHHDIAAYKRSADPSVPGAGARIAQLLTRFLAAHEHCVAASAGVKQFELVATVPSGSGNPARDEHHPLRRIVAGITVTASRHRRILLPAENNSSRREFDPSRYRSGQDLRGASVLLIDDMWTTGASVQSAAAALHASGAGVVAAVVVGRHLNRTWADNDLRLRSIQGDFSLSACPLCANALSSRAA